MELIERYKQALISLRPRGKIWQIKPGHASEIETSILAKALATVQNKADGLIDEVDVRTTKDCLEEWENIYGLTHNGSYEERIIALSAAVQKGSQTKEFFIRFCAIAGVEVDIVEHCPFMFGASQSGTDECGAENIAYYWEIIIKSGTDEAVAKMKQQVLKRKQSHTVLTFIDKREV